MADRIQNVSPETLRTARAINALKAQRGLPTDPGHTHDVTAATPAITVGTMTLAGHVRVTNPPAPALTGIVDTVDAADGAQIIAAQPVVPCKLQVRVVDANSSISAGTIALVGVGARGQAVSQTINLTGGTATTTTTEAFATLTSATIAGLVGAEAGDTIGIGPSGALGLPGPKTPTPTTFAVHKASVDDVDETVGTVDATAGTIVPTTAPDGAKDFDFWFTCNVVPTATQASHDHGGATSSETTGLNAADGAIHLDASERTVTAADASSLATSRTLAKNVRAVLLFHLRDAGAGFAHLEADATNEAEITLAAPTADTTLADLKLMAEEYRTAFDAHLTQSGVHLVDDSDASHDTDVPTATDQTTLNNLLNQLKSLLNAHIARVPANLAPALRVTGSADDPEAQ